MGKRDLQEKVLDYLLSSGLSGRETIREVDLAERFGVSATPVREALNSLEEKGFVERRKRKGTYLKPVSLKELNEVYDVRSVLEGLAAKLLCGVATRTLIGGLEKIHAEYERKAPGRGRAELAEIDLRFHSLIVDSCGNRKLARLVRDFHIISKSFRARTESEKVHESGFRNPYTHRKIIDALRENNPAKAEKFARMHVEWAKENMMKRLLAEGT